LVPVIVTAKPQWYHDNTSDHLPPSTGTPDALVRSAYEEPIMRHATTFTALTLALLAATTAWGQEKSFQQVLDESLPGIGATNIPDRQAPQQQLQDACFQLCTAGKEAQRADACKRMTAKLGPETAKPARLWLLKQLEFIGRAECVDAVARLLDDKDAEIFDWARRALENNPAVEANAPLLAKLQSVECPKRRLALVNSLGQRRDQASVDVLAKYLTSNDKAIALAAANALGKIGGDKAAARLDAACPMASKPLRLAIADAYLRCADQLLAQGKADQAVAIYVKLLSAEERPLRLAALAGQLNTASDQMVSMIVKLLASDNADARAVAAAQLVKIRLPEAMGTLPAEFLELPAAGQVLLVGGLAARGDKVAQPLAVMAAKSQDAAVKLAGYRALGKLGDASTVPLLLEAVFASSDVSGPARESLLVVFGPGVDEAIVAAFQGKDAKVRSTLIDIVDARRTSAATPVLLEQAKAADAGIRSRAVRTLGNVAEPKYIPDMIAILLKTPKGSQRDDLEKAIMFVAGRISDEDHRAEPVLAAARGASEAERCLLLPVAGRIGGKAALEAILTAIKSDSGEIQDAGVRALCNWPDASVADELARLATTSSQETHRIWALRAYIRVIGLDQKRQAKKTLALFQKAMEMATRDDERRLVLSRSPAARCVETMRWALPYLDNEKLTTDASRAVVELAHRRELLEPNRAEFVAALKRVTEVCKDRGLVDRANRILQGL
jgi:HEAT repeat protein